MATLVGRQQGSMVGLCRVCVAHHAQLHADGVKDRVQNSHRAGRPEHALAHDVCTHHLRMFAQHVVI